MKLTSKVIVLLACLLMAVCAEAGTLRPASWNYALMGIGGAALAFGLAGLLATSIACPPALAIAVLITGAVSVGIGSIDEIHEVVVADAPPTSSFASEVESWDDVNEQMQRQLDNNAGGRRKGIGSWFRDLVGVKQANAGELEPLQPIDQFIAENSGKSVRSRDKNRKKDSPKRERRRKLRSPPSQSEATGGQQPDLHNLNLDDPNGDWCECPQPGCSANMDVKKGLVVFGCSKCKKVNVKYARMALELERKMKAAGESGQWVGANAEASAHKAASEK